MAKKQAVRHVDLEEISQDIPDEEPETAEDDESEIAGKAISKAAAVRDALNQGKETPDDGVAYIRKTHGIEISKQMFSSYKTQEKARQAKRTTAPKGKPKEIPGEAAGTYLSPPEKHRSASDPDMLVAMEAMKPLVAALGVEKVKRIADLLG